jgi:hypothetical protein
VAAAPAPREHWARLAEVKAWPPAADSFRTQGHLVDADRVVVRVSPEARDAYLTLVTDSRVPDGTVVAAFHQQSALQAPLGPIYVMVKSRDAWSYLVLDATGGIIEKEPKGCAGCHAAAVADHLFGPPRPNLRSRP